MAAFEKWQEAISENIAAASVPGYKKTEISFSAVESSLTALPQGTSGTARVAGAMPSASPSIDYGQGQLTHSDNQLDFAIQGKGFFKVQQPDGKMAYTRNGQFHLGPDKTLLNPDGMPVQGEAGPIILKNGSGRVSVNAEGEISQDDTPIAKLPIFTFQDNAQLRRVGEGLVAPKDSSVPPAKKMANPKILNNYIENSNVSPLGEMVNLVAVSRAYEASQKVVQTADDNEGKAIQALGNPNS